MIYACTTHANSHLVFTYMSNIKLALFMLIFKKEQTVALPTSIRNV